MNDEDIKKVKWRLDSLRKTHAMLADKPLNAQRHYELTNKAQSLAALLGEDFQNLGADLIYANGPLGNQEYRRKLVRLMLDIFRECRK